MKADSARMTRKQKKRAEQVREAQRRRREKLRATSCFMMQVILTDDMRKGLEAYALQQGIGLQRAASSLIWKGLGGKSICSGSDDQEVKTPQVQLESHVTGHEEKHVQLAIYEPISFTSNSGTPAEAEQHLKILDIQSEQQQLSLL